ncbi:MAG: alpha-amylase family glycosyl hydrolase [Pseudomonadota bacterium]
MKPFRSSIHALLLGGLASLLPLQTVCAVQDTASLDRPVEDEVVYFMLPDRFANGDPANDTGGLTGGRLATGFEPRMKGFYHGGDLAGVIQKLDYIQGLGATAVWLGPIYKNKPVQGPPGEESAGYHGYWITDFTSVDPHFGDEEAMKAFVEAAHARGMKVYLDIITNHTADVILLRECHDPDYKGRDRPEAGCPYRSLADYPYTTKGAPSGAGMNRGFMGDAPGFQTTDNFAKLKRPDYAYTPYIPKGEEAAKAPAWLNDPIYYHNRGETTWTGESSKYGDFSGLDDLFTEHPRVVEGFIDIYKDWITKYRIDGFRIDTAKHVNAAFWKEFIAAMLIHAEAERIPDFYIFGEVYDPDPVGLAPYTRTDRYPAVLDFAFQSAVTDVIAHGAPTERLNRLFFADALYEGGEDAAGRLPVFVGNHDMGRFSTFVRNARPDTDEDEIAARVLLGHAMAFFLRGVPVIYYGDEQGFVGDGGDQDAREDMFPSRVAIYNDNDLLATDATTAEDNFDTDHPFYRAISGMAEIYREHAPLRRGRQIVRHYETAPATPEDGGLFAVSRLGAGEHLVAFNVADQSRRAYVSVDARSSTWTSVHGACASRSAAAGSVFVDVPALGYVICKSNPWSSER